MNHKVRRSKETCQLKAGVPRAFLYVLSVLSVYSVRNHLLILKRHANLKVGVPKAFPSVSSSATPKAQKALRLQSWRHQVLR